MLSPGRTACGAHPHHHGTAVCCGTGDFWSLSCTSDKRVTERGFSAQLPGALSTLPAVPGARPCTCQGCGAVCSSACYRCSSRKHVGERRPCVPCVPCVPTSSLRNIELFSKAAAPRPFPPQRLGASAALCPCRFHIWAVGMGCSGALSGSGSRLQPPACVRRSRLSRPGEAAAPARASF